MDRQKKVKRQELTFTVTVYLKDEVSMTTNDIGLFNEGILNAVVNHVDTVGLTPEDLETFTRAIEVKCADDINAGECYRQLG